MSAPILFEASEVAIVALAVGTMAFGVRLARRHPGAGWAAVAGAAAWLIAEGAHWIQAEVIMPRVEGEEHDFARVLVTMLGEAVYFGVGGIGILLLFFAAVADRAPREDQRPEPGVLARRVLGEAWRYYNSRDQRGRYGR
ncbi:hypothetical protein AB0N05_07515 [Nocardia sp. NPDC051030]|uniref:hypothetical protein n=1 Tax=Nocardia sp. NPDC051030 TaxID=3155162 RepID=UPI0034470A38